MPRKDFLADLNRVKLLKTNRISHVHNVEDGQLSFRLHFTHGTADILCVVAPDVNAYPSRHTYQFFATDGEISAALGDAIEGARMKVNGIRGLTLEYAVALVGDCCIRAVNPDSALFEHASATVVDEPSPIGQDWPWGDTVWRYIFGDTQQANEARAFRVGYYGKFTSTDKFYLSVSIRIRKLGIPEVSVQAWDLDPGRYFVVLMRFGEGYTPTPDASEFASKISFRIGTSETYKPSEADVVQAFSQDVTTPEDSRPRDSWKPTFISPQLNELFNERFGSILEARKRGMDWAGAEMYVDDVKCGRIDPRASVPARYLEREKTGSRHVDVVTQDHFYAGWDFQKPFATIAMGFALRHFVRCTEFCLTCHRKLPYQLEAIKPYVCDGLCLYQYMNYSLGPSLEHEILTQPYVVDLLISLCYTSAAEGALRLFPSGLSLKVPYFGEGNTNPMSKVKMKTDTMELLFDGQHSLEAGGWVAIREHNPKGHHGCYHHRVEEVSGSSARLSLQVRTTVPGISEWKFTSQYVHVEVVKYETNLDDLTDEERRKAIALQLCLLPSVKEMTEYLKVGGRTLESWESLNRAALGLLRWIVASNRSCIMQVEDKAKIDGMAGYLQFRFAMGSPEKEERFLDEVELTTKRLGLKNPTLFAWHGSPASRWHMIIREGLNFNQMLHGRAYGDGVYHALQFHTSHGYAPRSSTTWPQSMIGVNSVVALNEIVNAPDEFVSRKPFLVVSQLDWIQTRYLFVSGENIDRTSTANSDPQNREHVAQDPAQSTTGSDNKRIQIPIECLQPSRRPGAGRTAGVLSQNDGGYESDDIREEDKAYVAPTEGWTLNDLRQFADAAKNTDAQGNRYRMDCDDQGGDVGSEGEEDMGLYGDDMETENEEAAMDSDDEDEDMYYDDDDLDPDDDLSSMELEVEGGATAPAAQNQPAPQTVASTTNYVPGTLDYTALPMLPAPREGGGAAALRLMKELREIDKTIKRSDATALGWHVDVESVTNVFQWMVELHSFPAEAALTADMRGAGITSVVLELRFLPSYPMSPPFVRVVRPRLLAFAQGGGGHVTAGGALCMKTLTADGWRAILDLDNVFQQIRFALVEEPRPARLERPVVKNAAYSWAEAVDGYLRACRTHGWRVPDGFVEAHRA